MAGFGGQRPLLAFCASVCAGAFIGCELPPWTGAALALCALLSARWKPGRAFALGLAFGLVRAAAPAGHPAPLPPPAERVEIEARVLSVEQRPSGPVAVVQLESGRAELLLTGGPALHRGDLARLWARLRSPLPRLNPGGGDPRRTLARRGIVWSGSAEVLGVLQAGPRFWALLDRLRAGVGERAELLCTDRPRAALVAALSVGDRSRLDPETDDDLAASGLVHLLASAGLHLGVVVFAIQWVLRALLARVGLTSPGRLAALLSLPFAAAEVLLLGAPWPALRAGFGAAVSLLGRGLSRRTDAPTTLSLALAGCCALDPAAAHDVALQLSAAGIAGLLVLARPLRALVPFRPGDGLAGRLAEKMLELACATAAATLCTAPLLAADFHRLSVVSVFANALALPPGLAAIPIATLLAVFDSVLLWWTADGLAGLTLWGAHAFARLPFAVAWVPAPGPFATALWVAGLVLLARRGPARRVAFAACLFFAALGAGWLRTRPDGRLHAAFLAVGQGDSTVLQLPDGRAVLIDGGGDLRGLPAPGRPDPGRRDVLPALAELGVRRLDLVILSHPHPDHAGGLLAVLEHLPVGELWMSPGTDAVSRTVRAHAEAHGVPVRPPRPVQLGAVRLELVSSSGHDDWSANDASIVLRVVHGETTLLFPGDVEALAESELAQGPLPLAARVLKAPHHGSRTSSTDAFLRRVHPEWVIYSVGAGNPFGFPHPDVVARAEALGARTLRTDRGAVFAVSDGHALSIAQLPP